jgi:hypothetical protein
MLGARSASRETPVCRNPRRRLFGLASFVTELQNLQTAGDAFVDTSPPQDILDPSKSKSATGLRFDVGV